MKTTLDLPDDVAMTLRMESARRGGRRKASYSQLVSDAIRQVYMDGNPGGPPKVTSIPGRVVVHPADRGRKVSSEDVRLALDEE